MRKSESRGVEWGRGGVLFNFLFSELVKYWRDTKNGCCLIRINLILSAVLDGVGGGRRRYINLHLSVSRSAFIVIRPVGCVVIVYLNLGLLYVSTQSEGR